MFNLFNTFARFSKNNKSARLFYLAVLMLFFFCLFDGLLTNLMPILIIQKGISETVMGMIIGLSAIFGLIFDFWLCRVIKNIDYRRIYLIIFLLAAVFLLVISQANGVVVFLVAMAIWGLYYDLFSMANIDLVADTTSKKNYSTGFGVLRAFIGLGYLVATIVAASFIKDQVGTSFFVVMGSIWLLVMGLFVIFNLVSKGKANTFYDCNVISIVNEIRLWRHIGRRIFPVLAVTFLINVVDAFFWVVGPLLVHDLMIDKNWGAWFITLYLLPIFITGWLVGSVSNQLGKKRTALLALWLGFLVLTFFMYFFQSVWLLLLSFLASFFISFSWPAITGAYADFVKENPKMTREIESLQDSFTNLGFVVGPILAGWLAGSYGHVISFSILGWAGLVVVLILWFVTPRQIVIKNK